MLVWNSWHAFPILHTDVHTHLPSAVVDRDGIDFNEHEREVPALHGDPRWVRPVPPPGPKARVEDGKHVAVHLLHAVTGGEAGRVRSMRVGKKKMREPDFVDESTRRIDATPVHKKR